MTENKDFYKFIEKFKNKKFPTFDLNTYLEVNNPYSFCFRVSDDSMLKFGIQKGDIVVCRHDLEPKKGDLIVIYVNGGMKVWKKEDDIHPILIEYCIKVTNPRSSDPEGYFVGVVCSMFRSVTKLQEKIKKRRESSSRK